MNSLSHSGNKVSIQNFAREILSDLPTLMVDHPMGVTISDLYEYYKESEQRIARAILHLMEEDRIVRKRRVSGTYYITPKDYRLPRPHPELTHNQWKLLEHLWELRPLKGDNVTTNHSRLADHLGFSIGGVGAAMEKLISLEYVEQVHPYSKDTRQIEYKILIKPAWDTENPNVLPLEEDNTDGQD